MKIRIGITSPLVLTAPEKAHFRWPCFLERNFTIPDDFRHSVWVESRAPLSGKVGMFRPSRGMEGRHVLRGSFREFDLSNPESTVVVRLPDKSRHSWAWDHRATPEQGIGQTIEAVPGARPDRIVLVIDCSAGMNSSFGAIAQSLFHLPSACEVRVLFAADEVEDLVKRAGEAAVSPAGLAEQVRGLQGFGGRDNLPALLEAWDLAAEAKRGVVAWIHGPQPVPLQPPAALLQRLERRSPFPALYDFQVGPGPSRITESLEGIESVEIVPRLGRVGSDLERLFGIWSGKEVSWRLARHVLVPGDDRAEGKPTTSDHLVRLWAADEIGRLVKARRAAKAVDLAGRYQLVTRVSGAVVLETQTEYELAGLQPADPATVPSIPEPRAWLLLVGGFLLLLCKGRRREL
jgi:hypothetical protein